MIKSMNKKILKSIFLLGVCVIGADTPPVNTLKPYDVILEPRRCEEKCIQNALIYESSFAERAFQADDDERCKKFRIQGNPLQLWQSHQNILASLQELGLDRSAAVQQLIVDGNEDTFLVTPYADFKAHSLLWATRFYINNHFNVGFFIPFYFLKLHNVRWHAVNIDQEVMEHYLRDIEQAGNLDLFNGWERKGIGDCAALVSWYKEYPQYAKRWLRNVGWNLRAGLIFPTGKKQNENILLGTALGNDGGTGIIAGGRLDLQFGSQIHFGIDGEITHLFGDTRPRRIKTNAAETDLLLPTKVVAYKEFGFIQHYTLYLNFEHLFRCFTLQCAYQYTKHNDNKLYLCSNHFNPEVVNNAESLQEFTQHHGFFGIKYDPLDGCWNNPSIMLFYKAGFNGKRAIITDSIGFEVAINF
jgi:hypothetical protein